MTEDFYIEPQWPLIMELLGLKTEEDHESHQKLVSADREM